MKSAIKAAGATLMIAAGVALTCYFTVAPFQETVREYARRFKSDMDKRQAELIDALSSTEEEVAQARVTWESRQRFHRDEVDNLEDGF